MSYFEVGLAMKKRCVSKLRRNDSGTVIKIGYHADYRIATSRARKAEKKTG